MMRVAKDIIVTIAIVMIVSGVSVGLGLSLLYIIVALLGSILLGPVLSEQRWIRRWLVNIYRATRILMKQDDNPKEFIEPYMKYGNLFPDIYKGNDSVDYIQIILSWKNRIFKKLAIENIKGAISIEGSYPPDDLPYIESVYLEPLQEPLNPVTIPIKITGDALRVVKNIQNTGHGKVNISLSLSVNIGGVTIHYDIKDKIDYVG